MNGFIRRAVLPGGFKASGASCGLKKSLADDLALFYSDLPATAAAVFTRNLVKAAPLTVNMRNLRASRSFRAVIANSGNANCYTGQEGIEDALYLCRRVAAGLFIDVRQVLAASTGIIGRRMPARRMGAAVPGLISSLSASGIQRAQKAIMTTDTFSKGATAFFSVSGRKASVCGVAKGAGMIAPDMATMLCFIFTDAALGPGPLKAALNKAVAPTFNCITVDGCMSTNDNVILLANGACGAGKISGGKDYSSFCSALEAVCRELALMMVRDGEGASKFIRISVEGALNDRQARTGALAVANSNLFKTAVYGENRNFGRIIAALGSSGIKLDPGKIRLKAGSLKRRDVDVYVHLGVGRGKVVVYTSDLTPEYIKINAEYS